MFSLHFPGLDAGKSPIALAQACGIAAAGATSATQPRFAKLFAEAPRLWRASSLEESDLVIYPYAYSDSAKTRQIAELARSAGKTCVFFRASDDPTPAAPPYGIVYRDSIFADIQTPQERAMPAFCDDLLRDVGGQVPSREKQDRPVVGFCGYVGTAFSRLLYQLTGRTQKARGLILRHRTLQYLSQDRRIDCRFIRRTQFWGGAMGRFRRDLQRAKRVYQEYVDNILGTDYTLCLRGMGNFSFRLYEVLAAGRIPLFINTRCVLPFQDRIDWHKHCVWIEDSDLPHIGDALASFHSRISPIQFRQMQLENRKLWEEWLSPLSFYRRIVEDAVTNGAPSRVNTASVSLPQQS
ncbi:MAG: exostosin family protein [Bacillota bacterium]